MTSPEQYSDSTEHHIPKWQGLDVYIRKRITSAAQSIEIATPEDAQHQLRALNNHFISDGLIGLRAKATTGMASFVSTQITDEGVSEVPVYDIDLRGQREFVGEFKGCVMDQIQSDTSMNLLFYNFELDVEGYDQLHLHVPVDEGSVLVEYDDTDTWDAEVDGAFAVLETVEDDEYQAVVEGLRDAFWNTDQPTKLRLWTIGIHATELLAHPLHAESTDSVDALGVILLCSVDEELLYKVTGVTSNETVETDGRPSVRITNRHNPRILKPVGVRYVTNFEILNGGTEELDVTLTDTLQPALAFFDVKEKVELDYPFRYLADIQEYEYDQETFTDAHPVSSGTNHHGAIGDKTCGELSHEYNKRNNLEH